MRVVRLVLAGTLVVLVGVVLGFVAALLRPRRYAHFSGTRH